ncbi:large-conductance mechanosensitive channel protein MscL [Candidatus Nomurabacteria bacterium]|nr:large-conductance mechanosensitive channel protein MscL [Candidatus Nomurabacteria bacterium]
MKGFIDEFKAFAIKGNVIDLAVAVVIGTAFGKIVSSLVSNIITPSIGLIMGGENFSGLKYIVGDAEITYGVFLQSIIDFLIVSLVIFILVKAINKAKGLMEEKKVKEEAKKPQEPSEEIQLLREIRDSLQK